MLITKAQGIACRKAAEYIAAGKWNGVNTDDLPYGRRATENLIAIGWGSGDVRRTWFREIGPYYDQSEVLMALLWCATIAGEA